MAANLIGRYIWEISELRRSRHGLTLNELNERWERSSLYDGREIIRKTWYSHREQIASQFGIIIECDKRTNRYYIAYEDTIGRPDIQNWLLNSFAVGNMLMQGKDLKGRISYERIPSGYDYLTDIIEAMRENRIISISYQSYWKDEPSEFELMPYALKVFKQRWYLVGANVAFEGIRIYGLDRIKNIEITQHKFKMPKNFDVEELFEPYYGVSLVDGEVEKVRIKVYDNQAKYFRSLKLHESQEEIKTTPEYSIFEYHIKPTFEFEQELLSHGESLEVLEPADLRERIKHRLELALEHYKKTSIL